jgi:iron complex transport system permease protein
VFGNLSFRKLQKPLTLPVFNSKMKVLPTRKRFWISLLLALLAIFFLDLTFGSVSIPLSEIFNALSGKKTSTPVWQEIIINFRLTKSLTCILAGCSLAVGGLQMQTLFRNPLAGPDVFGLSSGASLAVSLVFMTSAINANLSPASSPWIIASAASIGSGLVSLSVLTISNSLKDNASLLIIGLMIGAGASSIVSVLQYISTADEQQSYLIWTFGNLGGLNWNELGVLTIIIFVGVLISVFSVKSLNTWMLGDNYARSLGINVRRSRLLIIISTSLLTGGVTAFCGPIAFVGLAVPHLTRMVIKTSNHKTLIPSVLITGAGLMLLCDILSQLPGDSKILPINAITALIGAPVVIWIVIKGRKVSI